MEKFASYNPSIHSQDEEGYNWLESDEEWSRCLLIPNPNGDRDNIEVETCGEFVLYFGGSHAHYNNDAEGYEDLRKDFTEIANGRMRAFSCVYEGRGWCSVLNQSSRLRTPSGSF